MTQETTAAACRHCGGTNRKPGQRGLCRPCYDDPAVRRLYPRRNPWDYRAQRLLRAVGPCRHCGRGPATKPRKLCRRCYETPEVRCLYPTTAPAGRSPKAATRKPDPTDAAPGSEEKLRVLEGRAARGEWLWHPEDNVPRVPPGLKARGGELAYHGPSKGGRRL